MSPGYLALVDGTPAAEAAMRQDAISLLHELGFVRRFRIGSVALYLMRGTEALALPLGTHLVGELYTSSGCRVRESKGFQRFTTQRQLREHLLESFWGEYVLFQPNEEKQNMATFITRDPSGALSCAYSDDEGFITSDISLVSRLGLAQAGVDWDFIEHFLSYSHTKIARSGVAGVSELLPGCMLEIAPRRSSTSSVWTPWRFVQETELQRDINTASHFVRKAVSTVVTAMATTDQSLLLQLSGGLDSSIVAACLGDTDACVRTCTVVAPLPGGDERHYAERVSSRVGIPLLHANLDLSEPAIQFKIPARSLRPAVSPLSRAAARAMEPFVNAERINAVYSGGGGDTVFCYLRTASPATDALRRAGWAEAWNSVLNLTKLHRCTAAKATWLAFRKLVDTPHLDPSADRSLLRASRQPPLGRHPWVPKDDGTLPGNCERIVDLAGTQMFREVTLREDDKRVRMPLLSQPVMEACLRVPSWLWIRGGLDRAVARAAFADALPPEIIQRRSKGNLMGFNAALFQRHKATMRRFLLDGCLSARGIVDADHLNAYLSRTAQPRDRSFLRIFDLCMTENWVRQRS